MVDGDDGGEGNDVNDVVLFCFGHNDDKSTKTNTNTNTNTNTMQNSNPKPNPLAVLSSSLSVVKKFIQQGAGAIANQIQPLLHPSVASSITPEGDQSQTPVESLFLKKEWREWREWTREEVTSPKSILTSQ